MPNHTFNIACPITKGLSSPRAIFFLAALVLAASACERSRTGEAPAELVVALEGAPLSLDPRLAQDAYSERILPLIYHRLFAVGKNMEPEPDLVESFEQSDPVTYVFHLRAGRRFAGGAPLTAADVVYTLKSLSDPALKSPKKYIADLIEEIRAPDEYTVIIRLKQPYAPLLHELTVGIVPRPANGAAWDPDRPFGSGPYRVESFEPGARVVLAVNPDYDGPAPAIARIVFRVLEDDVTRVLALERGEVHLLQNCTPPDDLPLIQKNPGLQLLTQPGINYTYMGLNLEDPVLKDVRVRRAMAHAINRGQIASCLLKDSVVPAAGMLAPGHWAYNPDVPVYDYDPARAKALLDAAGFPDPDGDGPQMRFNILYKTSTLKERRWIAAAIADQLRQVGIAVEVRALEFGTFFNDIRAGRFQIYTLTWPSVTEPDLYYYVFNSASLPPHGGNRNRYRSQEVDRLTEQGRAEQDRAERKKIYARVQQIVASDLPYISLWYSINTAAMDGRLTGFEFYPGGDYRSLAKARWIE